MAEMYNWDNKTNKEKKITQKNPSFSSSLLDEIYRSIDGGDEKFGEFKVRKQKPVKKTDRGSKSKSAVEIAGFRQACLVDQWVMEMKANEKANKKASLPEFDQKMLLDNDPLFFSSGSSSSDSSFGWYSEAEAVKPKQSCFGPLNKVKTGVPSSSAGKKQNEFYPYDDDQTDKTDDSGLVRSKTRALKLYASLKKVKQPISPGGQLTTFINAIFTNGHSKKSKDLGCDVKAQAQTQTRNERKSKSTNVSTCSSASSFSRSCLNKNISRPNDHLNNGIRRTVTFLDREDSRPCGPKNVRNVQDFDKLPHTTFPWARTKKPNFNEFLRKCDNKKIDLDDDDEEEDEDDIASDSSSDLFELDHLAMLKNEQYSEELPVCGTTHMGTNRAIASGLVC
ncbi:protein BIG GRAIN 1-like B [Bidens hawaiensis]|uniref:protein BIG GRAIN 1-like B n=1 Tax=Bidens hawaiensis TaxID=980011 RepID=UPI00404B0059